MKVLAYFTAILSAILGMGSIGLFTLFLYVGPFKVLVLPVQNLEILLFDAALCFTFFLQHSTMVRHGFKRVLTKFVPSSFFSAIFSIVSGIILFILILLWQESPITLLSATGLTRWLVRGTFLLILSAQMWALFTLQAIDIFGIEAVIGKDAHSSQPTGSILLAGAYGWVRHPIYLTSILLIWCYPDLTADRLLLNILFTLWIIVGAIWEERDLVALHGDTYRTYQRQVPMLIPYRWPKA